MKKNIFINACFLLFLLFCFSNSIEAVEPEDTTRVYSARSCVSVFENQTVSSSRTIAGCDSLIVRGVTVSDVGNLTLTLQTMWFFMERLKWFKGEFLVLMRKKNL